MSNWFPGKVIIHTPTKPEEIEALRHAQRILHCEPSGIMDEATRMHLRGLQMMFKLRAHGALDGPTADALDTLVVPQAIGSE